MRTNPLVTKLETVMPLNEDDRLSLDALLDDVVEVGAKRDIISQGDRPEVVHLILEGWAARYTLLADGSRQILAFLLPGDFCDIHATILGEMDHGIVAVTPCKVAFIAAGKFDALTTRRATLTRALWWTTLVDEGVLREWIVNNGRRDAYEAVAHLLCEMHARMKMIGLVEDNRLDLPLTQEDIADSAGLTPVHINRVLRRLRDEGLIELRHRVLTVLDVAALKQAGGFDDTYLHGRRRQR